MYLKSLKNSNFVRAIITLTSGSILAQALVILVSPLLTRIYTPEELGVYALVLTAESIFGGIICGRYDISIVSEPKEKNIFPIIKLSFIITFFFSILATLLYGSYYFGYKQEYSNYTYAVVLIFFMLIINGLMRILESYNNRYKEYKIMTSVYVRKSFAQNIGSVTLGFLKFGVFGLLISHVIGMLFGLKKQSSKIRPYIRDILNVKRANIISVMKKHKKLPIYSAPATFSNRFSYASIALFIESLYGLTVLGFYSISYKVLGLPLTVMSKNIAKVFFEEASREYDSTGKFADSFKKTSFILLLIAIPMVLLLYFLSPFGFELLFGEGWGQAGVYVQILAPMFGIRFIVNTIAYGLQVVNKQHLELILQAMFIVSSILCFVASKVLMYEVESYLVLISSSFSVVYILYYFAVMYYANKK